jgi:hypothetical protein
MSSRRALGGVSPEVWDRLAGRNFYSSDGWLSFCEKDFGGDSGAAVSFSEGQPVCALPFVEVHDSLPQLYRWPELLARRGLPAPSPGGLLIGPREGYQTHILSSTGRPSASGVAAIIDQLRRVPASGDNSAVGCVAMYVTTDDALALQRAGVTAIPVLLEPDAWIEIPEGGWAAWEASLPARRRNNVRREVRQFREAGYQVHQLALSECWQELGAMASASQAKYGRDSDPEPLLRALSNHVACMGDAARTILCRTSDGDPVGFCLYYVWRDTIFLRWAGFDYERLVGAAEYFNLCYYAQIELASELGLRWLHAGIKSTEAKALRGAQLRPLWLVDIAEDSILGRCAKQIRLHNARRYEGLKEDPRTAGALDHRAWEAFSSDVDLATPPC